MDNISFHERQPGLETILYNKNKERTGSQRDTNYSDITRQTTTLSTQAKHRNSSSLLGIRNAGICDREHSIRLWQAWAVIDLAHTGVASALAQ